jgi:hypothetical protein
METFKDFLWPVVAIGGLGAFIDFLIGKPRQARAKDFLFRWWVRFDDIKWRNFGREEGLFAGHLIGEWFGQRLFSARRFLSAIILLILFVILGLLRVIVGNKPEDWCFSCNYLNIPSMAITWVMILFLGFSLSISFTKFLTLKIANLCGIGKIQNLLVFSLLLIVNYIFLVVWWRINFLTRTLITVIIFITLEFPRITGSLPSLDLYYHIASGISKEAGGVVNDIFVNNISLRILYPSHLISLITESTVKVASLAPFAMTSFISFFRFILSIIFVGSFLLRPLVMRPISLVWARIIESEKPVFTLTFGGAAALGAAISEAAKHL